MLAMSCVEVTMSFMSFTLSNRKDSCEVKNCCSFSALCVFAAVTRPFYEAPNRNEQRAHLCMETNC